MRALIADIVKHAARLTGYAPADIRGKSRVRQLVRVRQAVCLVAREQTRRDGPLVLLAYSLEQIGIALSDRDHSTIHHACTMAANIAKRDPEYAALIDRIRIASAAGGIFAPSKVIPWKPTPGLTAHIRPPAPIRVWEEIGLPSEHKMRLDQDGWTMDDHARRAHIIAGSQKLADAIQQARAA